MFPRRWYAFPMNEKRTLLKHFLAALAYRTQKALRDAPPDFGTFRAAAKVRTPHELIQHMDGVLGYARTFFVGGRYRAPVIPDFRVAVEHFHGTLADVARHLESGTEFKDITAEKLLKALFSDAMTHAGSSTQRPTTNANLTRCAYSAPCPSSTPCEADLRHLRLRPLRSRTCSRRAKHHSGCERQLS